MSSLQNILTQTTVIDIDHSGPTVEETVAKELKSVFCPKAEIRRSPGLVSSSGTVRVAVVRDKKDWKTIHPALGEKDNWSMVRKKSSGGVEIMTSRPHLLYGMLCTLTEEWGTKDAASFDQGVIRYATFPEVRPVFDLFLNQYARTVRDFNKEDYFGNMARLGFSYAEVNGLAFPVPFETGPKGELLHRFYTYCPALDQFVTSKLNKGFYDEDYLQANLNNLKDNAQLAEKYGMKPGLVCFEPRSVPDELLQRYPVLRGARVDHPMRSFRPRYNLSIAHPVVREHYAEMMENLMHEAPNLSYVSIWSNDSGAGFEYTSSLYVGRNGGGYVVREWLGAKDIAHAAALNLVRFMKVLRDAGRKVNPQFRTLIRLEPFWEEHEHIWEQLENGLDVEVSSLQTKGWDLSYKHPKYPEVPQIHGTALYNRFVEKEKPLMEELQKKGAETDVYFTPAVLANHEPLIGIAFPQLVFDKLKDMAAQGVVTPCYYGGATPQKWTPYNINEELVRAFQLDSSLDLNAFLKQKATEWIGLELADDLVKVWTLSDESFRCFPVPIWIYSGWGVWYRLFIRPIIPNIEAVSEKDREYYENFLLATTHNRTRVDFRYDVGFDMIEPSRASLAVTHFDDDLLPTMQKALTLLKGMEKKASSDKAKTCVRDQHDRMRALNCWYKTQRNVTAWVAGVHGYLESKDEKVRKDCRALLKGMVLDEIENTKELLNLWETSKTNWMIISEVGETTFIYYKNLGELMKKKIALMHGHENDEPYVDPNFQWRVPGFTGEKQPS
ncbi:MAG TPA: hypothetical protein VGB89_01445 [Bacteroidota bacterium]